MTRHNMPSEFPKGLLKRPTLKAADDKQFRCLNEILFCFALRLALSGDVQRRTMGYVLAILLLHDAEQLKLCLDDYTHAGRETLLT